jgi:DNA-binding Xre family transcriptional regulator
MNQIVDLVEAEMVRSNVSVETLSARTGIKLRLLKTVLRDRHMTLRMLATICVVLGLEPNFRHQDIDPKHLRT